MKEFIEAIYKILKFKGYKEIEEGKWNIENILRKGLKIVEVLLEIEENELKITIKENVKIEVVGKDIKVMVVRFRGIFKSERELLTILNIIERSWK